MNVILMITCLYTVSDTRSQTEDFDMRFNRLLEEAKSELTFQNQYVEAITYEAVKYLPCSVQNDHFQHVQRTSTNPNKKFVKMKRFFPYLHMYSCNFLEYTLLQEVVECSDCSYGLNNKILQYEEDLQRFQRQTKCLEYIPHQKCSLVKEVLPPHVELLIVRHEVDLDQFSLADMYHLRNEVCQSMDLPQYFLMNVSLAQSPDGIEVKWMLPTELGSEITSFLRGKIGQRLLRSHQVVNESVLVMEQPLYKQLVSLNNKICSCNKECLMHIN